MAKFFSIILSFYLVIAGQSYASTEYDTDQPSFPLISSISTLVVGTGLVFAYYKFFLQKDGDLKGQITAREDENTLQYKNLINKIKEFDHEYLKNYPYQLDANQIAIENLYDRTFTLLVSLYLDFRTFEGGDSVWYPDDFLLDCNKRSFGQWDCPTEFYGYKGYFSNKDETPIAFLKEDALAYFGYNLLREKTSRIKQDLLIQRSKLIYNTNKRKTLADFADAVDCGQINLNNTRDEIHEFLGNIQRPAIKDLEEYVNYLNQSSSSLLCLSHPKMLVPGRQVLEHSMNPRDVPGR